MILKVLFISTITLLAFSGCARAPFYEGPTPVGEYQIKNVSSCN